MTDYLWLYNSSRLYQIYGPRKCYAVDIDKNVQTFRKNITNELRLI